MENKLTVRFNDEQMEKISKLVEQGMTQSEALKYIVDAFNPDYQKVVQKISTINPEGDILETVNKVTETYKRFGNIKILPKGNYSRDELRTTLGLKEHSKEWQTVELRDINTIHYYKWKNLN